MRKSLKIVLGILVIMCLIGALTACGDTTTTPTTPDAPPPAPPEPPPPPAAAPEQPAAPTEAAGGAAEHAVFASPSDFMVGFAIKNQHNAYLIAMEATMQEQAANFGYELVVLNAGGDAAQQQEDVETLITMGADVIVMDSQDPVASIAISEYVAEHNIPLFFMNATPHSDCIRVTLVQSNNTLLGVGVGEWVADQINGDIKIGLLAGNTGNMTGYARRTGFITGLTERQLELNNSTNFIVRTMGWGNWSAEVALEAAEDMITAAPDINVIFAENDAMAFGAITAVRNAGLEGQVLIVGVDGQREALERIEAGEYGATGVNSPIELVRMAMQIMVDYMTGENRNIPAIVNTTPGLVHAGNVSDSWDLAF